MSCVSERIVSIGALGVLALVLSGCGASNQTRQADNRIVPAVAKKNLTSNVSVRRAAVRPSHQSNDYKKLRASYHAKWQAEQERQRRERAAQKARAEAAKRAEYKRQWDIKQRKREAERKAAHERYQAMHNVVTKANKHIGSKYVWGGASPKTGFDCSGLVQHSYRVGAGRSLPRTAAEQYKMTEKVASTHARKGDLVFFNTRGKRVSHVGIYMGGNRFVHAPRRGKRVRHDSIAGYWKKRLIGFGRIPGACRVPAYS